MSRADRRDNLRDGKALSRTWVSPLLVTISLGGLQMGVKNGTFCAICFRRIVIDLCRKHDPLKRGAIVYSSDGRRLTCVLNNIHRSYRSVDIVYRACTVGVG